MRILLFAIILMLVGCTEQSRARNYGGKATLKLPVGKKLVNVTWKNDEIWYLVRPMGPDDEAETYTFYESSSYGVFEGMVTLEESK